MDEKISDLGGVSTSAKEREYSRAGLSVESGDGLFARKFHAHRQVAAQAINGNVITKNRASQSGDDQKARGIFESVQQ